MDSHWLACWGLSLTGLRFWSWWRVSVPDCDTISGVPLEGALLTGVPDWNQWRVLDLEVSPAPCTKTRWISTHCFSTYCRWVWLGIQHTGHLDEWCTFPCYRHDDTIIDGWGVCWWRTLTWGTDRPLLLIGSGRCWSQCLRLLISCTIFVSSRGHIHNKIGHVCSFLRW